MLKRRAETGGHEKSAELVAIQRDSVRFVVHPRPPDMGGRGVLQEFFLHGVLVEPAMVHSRRVTVARARPLTSRSLAKLSMSARRTANRFRERARHQLVNWRRSSA